MHPNETDRRETVLFIAGFGPIVREIPAGRARQRARHPVQGGDGRVPPHRQSQGRARVRPLAALPGRPVLLWNDSWPDSVPAPQAWLEFDLKDVAATAADLESRGYRMLIRNKKEPWGQTVSRFLDPNGILVGITFTPQLREEK